MRLLATAVGIILSCSISAQNPWKWKKSSQTEGMVLHIDLNEESITVPSMEMFGPMNGYLGGKGVYGVWTVTSFKVKDDNKATLRLSNDLGSETQEVRLTLLPDSTYKMELLGTTVVKKVVNNKLAKVSSEVILK